jgi:hypothetical protein
MRVITTAAFRSRAAAGLLLVSAGCAGGTVYQNGINHVYLCATRVVRTNGYQVREEDFGIRSGTLVAARSVPDPRETPMNRGFLREAWEVIWNVWERGEFEFWDKDIAQARARTEERVVVTASSGSGLMNWLGLGSRKRTTVKVKVDETDYGRSDWVIRRKDKPAAVRDGIYAALADCLVTPSKYALKKYQPPAPVGTSPPAVAEASPTAGTAAGTTVSAAGTAEPPVTAAGTEAGTGLPPSAAAVTEAGTGTPPSAAADPEKALTDARKQYEEGAFQDAVAGLESVIAAEPDNAEALGYLGAAYYQLKRKEESIGAYERYVRLVPSDLRTQEFLEELKRNNRPAP